MQNEQVAGRGVGAGDAAGNDAVTARGVSGGQADRGDIVSMLGTDAVHPKLIHHCTLSVF